MVTAPAFASADETSGKEGVQHPRFSMPEPHLKIISLTTLAPEQEEETEPMRRGGARTGVDDSGSAR